MVRVSKDAGSLKRHPSNRSARYGCAAATLFTAGVGVRRQFTAIPRLWTRSFVFLWGVLGITMAAVAQVDLPDSPAGQPMVISAQQGHHWTDDTTEIWWLKGNCQIQQGRDTSTSREAILWIDRADPSTYGRSKVTVQMEGDVTVQRHDDQDVAKLLHKNWFERLSTLGNVQVRVARVAPKPEVLPPIYYRASKRRNPPAAGTIQRTQFTTPAEPTDTGDSPRVVSGLGTIPPGMRRVEFYSRGDARAQARWDVDPSGQGWIGVIDGGVIFNVHGLAEGVLDISADRMVVWTPGMEQLDIDSKALQDQQLPLEIYMEGNIVFRQGDMRLYAQRMYYDVSNKVGTVLKAEMYTPMAEYGGLLRLEADVLRQDGPGRYAAENGFLTSSRMGQPGYRIQVGQAYYEDNKRPLYDPLTRQPLENPQTGEQLFEHDQWVTSRNNFLYLGQVPIFYWPKMVSNVKDSTYYIRRARIKNDRVLGTQILTNWDAFELLGIRRRPEGTDWDISLDYLNLRGFGHGTTAIYERAGFFGIPGTTSGLADAWGIQDRGTDNLGGIRRNLQPEKDYRWRFFWQHRQILPGDYQVSAELGWISDRNFLEQYYEREWDQLKDQSTGIELKRAQENISWSVSADARINAFFTQTEWLPRGDHFWLGQSLWDDRLTWYEHTSVGYARFQTASAPENPTNDPFTLLPWEQSDRDGERFATRQEIDWPMQFGVVKLVPFGLAEFAHWGEDVNGDDVQRFYWQTGIRASIPMWRINPNVEDRLLNLHGLAHKVVFDAELSVAESNRSIDRFPLYDPLDDDSIEAFRRRLATGGATPYRSDPFDSRDYALRSGMGSWVTAPSTEIADDLAAMRMGVRQRWQTKRGVPGHRNIIDWITLDTHATWFPKKDRDNFGEPLGLFDYDFRWHVGDRLTLLSDGIFDFFNDGQQVVTVGGFLSRPPRGKLYLGMRLFDGPIRSRILSMSYNYWMSEKWVSAFGTSVDLTGRRNIGQRLSITRIGESLLVSAGFTIDAARDNYGVHFAIEPRFLPKGRLGRVGGGRIPLAGAQGLE